VTERPHQPVPSRAPAMNIRQDPRMAGEVERYHTWPSGSRQTVASHSWQLARIVLSVWPDVPKSVLVEVLFHDVGEVGTGDVPYPVKKDNPEVGRILSRVEQETRLLMCLPWGMPSPEELAPATRHVVKLCEFIEMWEWGAQERLMGNQFGTVVEDRCRHQWLKMFHDLADPVVKSGIRYYIGRRYSEWPF